MNRKFLSVLLICMLMFSIVSPAFAADEQNLVVSVSDAIADLDNGDTTVTVDIAFDENPGVYAVNFALSYDENVLTYQGATDTHDSFAVTSNPASNQILLQGLRQKDYTDTGVITTLTFAVNEECEPGDYEVVLTPVEDKKVVSCYDKDKVVGCELGSGIVTVNRTIAPVTYTVVVTDGTGDGSYEAGASVAITADSKDGYNFDKWVVVEGDVTFAKETDKATTFTMPAGNVEVKATYTKVEPKPETPQKYTVVVTDGTGDGSYEAGTSVAITADSKDGYNFDKWVVVEGNVTFAKATDKATTFTMPAANVEVKATYAKVEPKPPVEPEQPKTYAVDIVYGDGDGSYEVGKTVTIKADAAPEGKTFNKWLVIKGDIKLANAYAAETTFVMPDMDVQVQAQYKTSGGSGGGGGFGGGGGAVVTPADKEDAKQDAAAQKVIVLTIGEKAATVDGKVVVCDVAPLIKDGRTYTPSRFVAEQLGAKVAWDEAKQLVTITEGDTVIELTIGSNVAKVNGKSVEMDAAAFIRDGRTYTPSRFVAEQLGAKVVWNETTRQVTITDTIEVK